MRGNWRLSAVVASTVFALACGSSTDPTSQGLPLGLYSVFVPLSNPNIGYSWRASWPSDDVRAGCAFFSGSITIVSKSTLTETRSYSSNLQGSVPIERAFSGTYRYSPSAFVYVFSIDGGTDTVSLAGTVINGVSHEELMMRRYFPLRGNCDVAGPIEISYVR